MRRRLSGKSAPNGSDRGGIEECHWQFPWLQQIAANDRSLTSLQLKPGDRIPDGVVTALAKALRKNTSLMELDAHGDGITDASGMALAEAMQVNHTLQKVSLDTDRITNKTGFAFAEALRTNNTLVSMTLISRHPETYFCGAAHRQEMNSFVHGMAPTSEEEYDDSDGVEAVQGCRKRKRPEPSRQWMTDKTLKAFEKVLPQNRTLRRLELGVSHAQKTTLNALARALRSNTSMEKVFVNGREINKDGEVPRRRINPEVVHRAAMNRIRGVPLTRAQQAAMDAIHCGA
jgi:hypothetical protein